MLYIIDIFDFMKANELRIGNLITYNNEVFAVFGFDNSIIKLRAQWAVSIVNADPIPLTEEWLLKFGFERHWEDDWANPYYILTGWGICINADNMQPAEFGFEDVVKYKLQFVHQIQNLYFALTGEELTIK